MKNIYGKMLTFILYFTYNIINLILLIYIYRKKIDILKNKRNNNISKSVLGKFKISGKVTYQSSALKTTEKNCKLEGIDFFSNFIGALYE